MITSARLTAGSGVADAFLDAFRRSMRTPEVEEEAKMEDLFAAPAKEAERATPPLPATTKPGTFVSGNERWSSGTLLNTYA